MSNILTDAQVFALNEKHGWFHYGDAQSDVSKAFAQDVIDTYELMRKAAPQLLAALQEMVDAVEGVQEIDGEQIGWQRVCHTTGVAYAAIKAATGAA